MIVLDSVFARTVIYPLTIEEERAMNEFIANLKLVEEANRRASDGVYDRRTEAELVAAVKRYYQVPSQATFNGEAS